MLDYSVLLPKCVTLEKCWNVGCIAHVLFAGQKNDPPFFWHVTDGYSVFHLARIASKIFTRIHKFIHSFYSIVYSHFSISFLLCECVPHCGSTRFSRITLLPGLGVDWQESLEKLPPVVTPVTQGNVTWKAQGSRLTKCVLDASCVRIKDGTCFLRFLFFFGSRRFHATTSK